MVGCIGTSVCVALQIYERGWVWGAGKSPIELPVASLWSLTDFALYLLLRENA